MQAELLALPPSEFPDLLVVRDYAGGDHRQQLGAVCPHAVHTEEEQVPTPVHNDAAGGRFPLLEDWANANSDRMSVPPTTGT